MSAAHVVAEVTASILAFEMVQEAVDDQHANCGCDCDAADSQSASLNVPESTLLCN